MSNHYASDLLGKMRRLSEVSGHAMTYIGARAVRDARVAEKLERAAITLKTAAALAEFLDAELKAFATPPDPSGNLAPPPAKAAGPKARVKAPRNVGKGRKRSKR